MPVEVIYENEGKGVRLRYTGDVNGDEAFDVLRAVLEDPRFIKLDCGISDFAGVDDFDISPSQVRQIAQHTGAYLEQNNPRVHLVMVPPKSRYYGVMRIFETQVDMYIVTGYNAGMLRVFETVEQAETWLLDRIPGISFE